LPEVVESDVIGGRITRAAARKFGLAEGTPMMVGLIDTGAAMVLTGARVGQLLNVSGSTDVLALCTDRPVPHDRLLTRALGVGRKWMSVSTLAAAGSAIQWAREQFFSEMTPQQFNRVLTKVAAAEAPVRRRSSRTNAAAGSRSKIQNSRPEISSHSVTFEPYLAGERTSIEQRRGAFGNLTLATTREDLLAAIVESLARASAARLPLLEQGGVTIRRDVVVSGGTQDRLARLLHRDWAGKWTFRAEDEASLRGLAKLTPRER
jgi:xylulokinase